jgi:hypothetical protein
MVTRNLLLPQTQQPKQQQTRKKTILLLDAIVIDFANPFQSPPVRLAFDL